VGRLHGTGSDVTLRLDFTWLKPQSFSSGGFTCTVTNPQGGTALSDDWNVMTCTGFVAWGATAIIQVQAQSSQMTCGRIITYTDAFVSTTAMERSRTNNRAIARTDVFEIC
jgi:hypothetical protein